MEKKILFTILIVLLCFNVIGVSQIYDYTDYEQRFLNSGFESVQSCDDYIYFSNQGSRGFQFSKYDINENNVTDRYYYLEGVGVPTTLRDTLLYVDCENDLLYSYVINTAPTPDTIIFNKYNLTGDGGLFNNRGLSGATQTTIYGKVGSSTLNSENDEVNGNVIKINDKIFINSNDTILRFDADDHESFVQDNSLQFLDDTIRGVSTDGEFLYVVSNTTLYKLDIDLDEISRNVQYEVSVNEFSYNQNAKYLQYSSFDDRFYLIVNRSHISIIDTDLNVLNTVEQEYTFSDTAFNSQKFNGYNLVNNIYYSSDTLNNITRCSPLNGSCDLLFNIDEMNNWTQYHPLDISSGGITVTKGLLLTMIDSVALPVDRPMVSFFNGFDEQETVTDIITINSINSDLSIGTTDNDYNINGSATHSFNNNFLTYAFDCDNLNTVSLYKETFEFDKFWNETNNYINPKGYTTVSNSYSIDGEKSLIFDNTNFPFSYNVTNTINNRFRFSYTIGHSEDQNYTLTLLNENNSEIVNLTFIYDSSIRRLQVIDNINSKTILNKALNNLNTPVVIDRNNVYTTDLYIDMSNETYILRVIELNSNEYKYSSRESITFSNSLSLYTFTPTNSTDLNTEIFEILIDKQTLPIFTENNQVTCNYITQGLHTVTMYVSSTLRGEDYSNFISLNIEVLPPEYNESTLRGALNEVLDQEDGFTVDFWILIMFIGFSIIVATGVGMFNKWSGQEERGANLQILWLEFLFAETLMLWFMCTQLILFPVWYFYMVLIVDSLTITYYIAKALGGGGQ